MKELVKKLFIRNWQLKLLSLFLAILLWIFAVFEQPVESTIQIPINYRNIPKGMIIVGNPPKEINVEIKGPRALISRVKNLRPYNVSMGGSRPGTVLIKISPSRIDLPPGVEIIRIIPSEVEINIDKLITRKISVRTRTKGLLPPGLELRRIGVEPVFIKLTGAASQLKNLRYIYTEFIDLSQITSSEALDVELDVGNLTLTEITTRVVRVTISVAKKMILKDFKNIPVEVFGKKKYILITKLVSLKLYGPQTTLGKLTPSGIHAYINISGFKKGKRKAKIEVDLPPGTKLVEMSPLYAEVIIH